MFNYSSNYFSNIQNKKSYNQISIEKITNIVNQSKQRAFSINHMNNVKQKGKTTSSKQKAISVNKQIQYKKRNNAINDNTFFTSYNGISAIKAQYHTNFNKNMKVHNNINNNTNPKKDKIYGKSGVNNYSNNKLRRKMILSVDINNKKSEKNISQYNINNNIKLITDNENKNIENTNTNSNNTNSNPMSNGAKNNTNSKAKTISVNNTNNKNNINNFLIKSPIKESGSNNFKKYIDISGDKKGSQNNVKIMNNKKVNIQIRQPLKLFEQNSSVNLTTSTSGNYKVNFTNSTNDKKYTKPNLKNSNSTMYYKINNNNKNNKYNIYENNSNSNGEKIMKEVLDIQTEMEKNIKNNVTNSKAKKYNVIKHAFEVLVKLLGNSIFKNNNVIINILLEKILIGYHEVFNAFSMENRKLKQINYNLNEQYEKMSKDLFNTNKLVKERQKFIDNLQKKVSLLENNIKKKNANANNIINNIQNPSNINNNQIQNKDININEDDQNKKIFEINKQNVEDLDALYFYDKVKNKNDNKKKDKKEKKSVSIPKIIIKQPEEQIENEEEEEEYEIEEMNRTVIFSNVCGLFINSGDINFNSQRIINIRKAFIL